jgi:hypothetical protein
MPRGNHLGRKRGKRVYFGGEASATADCYETIIEPMQDYLK